MSVDYSYPLQLKRQTSNIICWQWRTKTPRLLYSRTIFHGMEVPSNYVMCCDNVGAWIQWCKNNTLGESPGGRRLNEVWCESRFSSAIPNIPLPSPSCILPVRVPVPMMSSLIIGALTLPLWDLNARLINVNWCCCG